MVSKTSQEILPGKSKTSGMVLGAHNYAVENQITRGIFKFC